MTALDERWSARLTDSQREAAAGIAGGPDRHHVVYSPPGTGKGFLAAALAASFLNSDQSVLVVSSPDQADRLAARTSEEGHHPVVHVTKAEARTAGPSDWPADTLALVDPSVLEAPMVHGRLSKRRWGLAIADAGRTNLTPGQLQALLALPDAERVLILTPVMEDVPAALARARIWSLQSMAGPEALSRDQARRLTYQRTEDEGELLAEVERLAKETRHLSTLRTSELPEAAASSFFALQARALRDLHRIRASRNLAVHSEVRSVDGRSESSTQLLLATFKRLEQIVIAVDNLRDDSKLAAVQEALPHGSEPVVIFVNAPETQRYVADSLRLIGERVLVVDRHTAPDDVASSEPRPAAIVVGDDDLLTLQTGSIAVGVNYDLPHSIERLYLRASRVSRPDGRLWTPIDATDASAWEKEQLKQLGLSRR